MRYGTFDRRALLEKFGGDKEFVRGLLEVVLRSSGPLPAALRDACAQADFASLAGLAHKVKGTAGDLVATALQTRAHDAELAARAREPGAVGLNRELADELELVLEEIRTVIAGAG